MSAGTWSTTARAPGSATLRERGLAVRHPERTFGTPDHYVSTKSHDLAAIAEPNRREMVTALAENAREHGITLFDLGDIRQGIVHIIGPEQGITQPGLLMVCGDSHTATHGALGALAFGIGASEVAHVLATQTLWQRRPKSMRITVDGKLGAGGHAEGRDPRHHRRDQRRRRHGPRHRIRGLGHSARCRWKAGSPSATCRSRPARGRAWSRPTRRRTPISKGRPFAPKGEMWDRRARLLAHAAHRPRRHLRPRGARSMPRAIAPMVTWGTSPEDAAADHRRRPRPGRRATAERRDAMARALAYMGLEPGTEHRADQGRPRVHRLLHQRPHRGPARRRRGRPRPHARRCRPWWCRAPAW